MRKTGAVVAALLAGLLVAPMAVAADEAAASSPTPPKDLKRVGDHWTPWNPPEPGPDDYIIQKGDTLWDLAGKWLGDPFLWPQVWDKNRYILDSHWIYPGDPLVVPGRPTVVPPEGPPPVEEQPEEQVPETPAEQPRETEQPKPPPLIPVASPGDLYCSGYIDPDHAYSDTWVVGREMEREFVGTGDVIYLNKGSNQGVEPGSEWAIQRAGRAVKHPETGADLGTYVRRLGRVRILAAQDNTSTAVITYSCDTIHESDEIVPWQEIPIPRLASMPAFQRYDVTPSGGAQGYIVALKDDIHALDLGISGDMGVHAVGDGHVIYTDLGQGVGIRPGDILTVYRENGDLPRLMLGQAVILTVEGGTSTAKLTTAVREIFTGDRVEVVQ
jgi:hypothetical protein